MRIFTKLATPIFFVIDELLLRPIRAMTIAYGHVFRGTKVETPMNWRDI